MRLIVDALFVFAGLSVDALFICAGLFCGSVSMLCSSSLGPLQLSVDALFVFAGPFAAHCRCSVRLAGPSCGLVSMLCSSLLGFCGSVSMLCSSSLGLCGSFVFRPAFVSSLVIPCPRADHLFLWRCRLTRRMALRNALWPGAYETRKRFSSTCCFDFDCITRRAKPDYSRVS